MNSKSAFALGLAAALFAGGTALAADVPADTQKALTDLYAANCTAAMDGSDKALDSMAAQLAPDYVNIDFKGKQTGRDESVASMKQQFKMLHVTSCDNALAAWSATDASTIVVTDTQHAGGDVQAPDGKHQFTVTSKTQDTWKNVGGTWLESQSKDLRFLLKVDGNVVQDQGE